MNIGIQDAVHLGHTLAALVRGRAPESELDKYERARRPIAREVVVFTDRLARLATIGRALRPLRNIF